MFDLVSWAYRALFKSVCWSFSSIHTAIQPSNSTSLPSFLQWNYAFPIKVNLHFRWFPWFCHHLAVYWITSSTVCNFFKNKTKQKIKKNIEFLISLAAFSILEFLFESHYGSSTFCCCCFVVSTLMPVHRDVLHSGLISTWKRNILISRPVWWQQYPESLQVYCLCWSLFLLTCFLECQLRLYAGRKNLITQKMCLSPERILTLSCSTFDLFQEQRLLSMSQKWFRTGL